MPEKKMKNIKRELIEQKLNLVVEKLMNLGGPENEAELKEMLMKLNEIQDDLKEFGVKI